MNNQNSHSPDDTRNRSQKSSQKNKQGASNSTRSDFEDRSQKGGQNKSNSESR